jgi:hypothetical protein
MSTIERSSNKLESETDRTVPRTQRRPPPPPPPPTQSEPPYPIDVITTPSECNI